VVEMAKFNKVLTAKQVVESDPTATENFEDGLAFAMGNKYRLFSRVLTTLFSEKKFYQDACDHDEGILNDVRMVAEEDPEFILKLAVFARQYMGLRSVPIVLLAEAALNLATRRFVRRYTKHIIRRADELVEVIAYIKIAKFNGGRVTKLPSCLKKGIAEAFDNFDEYQLLKYDNSKGLSIADIIKLSHPVPKDCSKEYLYGHIIGKHKEPDSKLTPIAYAKKKFIECSKDGWSDETAEWAEKAHATQELAIKVHGNKPEVWEAIFPTLGYMALLRNLTKICEVLDEGPVKKVANRIADPEQVKMSKQFPFRFLSAYRSLQRSDVGGFEKNYLLTAVAKALNASVANLPKIKGKTIVMIDLSASMNALLSERSSVSYKDVAATLGAVANKVFDEPLVYGFACDGRRINILPDDTVMSNIKKILKVDVGYSTNAYLLIRDMIIAKIKCDRIILISDMQCYDSYAGEESFAKYFKEYKWKVNRDVKLYSLDLTGYGTLQTPADDTVLIAGWTEKLFAIIGMMEANKTDMCGAIEKFASKKTKKPGFQIDEKLLAISARWS